MQIRANVRFNQKEVNLRFPIEDDLMNFVLEESQMPTDTTKQVFRVESILFPQDLSVLRGKEVNLDEMNYLAKRFDSFMDYEMEQFFAAVKFTKADNLKDMINLTFNLDKFTLIKDVGDMVKVGRDYVLNTQGVIPDDSKYDDKYAEIGRAILSSGKGIVTDKGLLFVEDEPIHETYDGQVFPAYPYEDFILGIDINYNDNTETVFLPTSDLAIEKAARRLGASCADDCKIRIEDENPNYDVLSDRFRELFERDGVFKLNKLLKTLFDEDIDMDKLNAAIDYTHAKSANDICVLVNHIDDFELIKDIDEDDYDEVGRYYLNKSDEYTLSEDLEEYFDFYEFGEHIADEKSGEFIPEGFMYYDGDLSLDYILDEFDGLDDEMSMGGL